MEEISTYMTLPDELEFRPSAVEPLKIGVWSKCSIEKDKIYGPFIGEKKKLSSVVDHTYSWEILGPKGRRLYCIDAINPMKANWMRYVKSARYYEEQNMIASQEDKNIYYMTLKKIPKGQELLCWYKEIPPTKPAPIHYKSGILNDAIDNDKDHEEITMELTKSYNIDGIISSQMLPEHSDNVPIKDIDGNIQNPCLGLDDSLGKVIASEYSVIDTTNHKGPVVRLIPLSAEIKLKVHLDLDIHLDADFKLTDDVLQPEDENKYPAMHVEDSIIEQIDKQGDTSTNISRESDQLYTIDKTVDPSREQDTPDNTGEDLVEMEDGRCYQEIGKDADIISLKATSNCSKQEYPMPTPGISPLSHDESERPKSEEVLPQSNNTPPYNLHLPEPEILPKQSSNTVTQQSSNTVTQQSSNTVTQQSSNIVTKHSSTSSTVTLQSSYTDTEYPSKKDQSYNAVTQLDDSLSDSSNYVKTQLSDECLGDITHSSDRKEMLSEKEVTVAQRYSDESSSPKEGINDLANEISQIKSQNVKRKAIGSSPLRQFKKIKRRMHQCQMCRKEFRKHVHLKIHISRMHTTRERKVTQYVARKREKILTRSLTHKVTVDRSTYPIPIDKSTDVFTNTLTSTATAGDQRSPILNKTQSGSVLKKHNNTSNPASEDLSSPSFNRVLHQSKHRKILPKPYTKPPNTSLQVTGGSVCKYCSRTFRYASWLDRHMVTHQQYKDNHVYNFKKAKSQPQNTSPRPPFQERPHSHEQLKESTSKSSTDANMQPDIKTPNLNSAPLEKDVYDYGSTAEDGDDMNDGVPMFSNVRKSGTGHTCSICGKYFTTKKNCRRHRRLIHNILVRPERTKLPYANYVIEKQYPPETANGHESNVTPNTDTVFRKATPMRMRLTKDARRPISVRMFNPSRIQMSDMQQMLPCRQEKLKWITSSNRTGPPPSGKDLVSAKEIPNWLSRPLFNDAAMSHTRANIRQPNPFIPKSRISRQVESPKQTALEGLLNGKGLMVCDMKYRPLSQVDNTTAIDVDQPMDLCGKNPKPNDRADLKKDDQITTALPIWTNAQSCSSKRPRLDTPSDKQPALDLKSINTVKETESGNQYLEPQQNATLPAYLELKLLQTPSTKLASSIPHERSQQKLTVYRHILPKPDPIPMQNDDKLTTDKIELPGKTDIDTYKSKKVFSCNACSLIFYSFHELEQHVAVHADDWPYRCEFCIQLFQRPHDLVFHRKNHHLAGKALVCKICKCKYASKKALDKHQLDCREAKHVESDEPTENAKMSASLRNQLPLTKGSEVVFTPEAACSHPVFQASTTYRCTKCLKQFTETMEFHSHIMDCALTKATNLV